MEEIYSVIKDYYKDADFIKFATTTFVYLPNEIRVPVYVNSENNPFHLRNYPKDKNISPKITSLQIKKMGQNISIYDYKFNKRLLNFNTEKLTHEFVTHPNEISLNLEEETLSTLFDILNILKDFYSPNSINFIRSLERE